MEHFYKVYKFQLIEKNIFTLVLYLTGRRFNYLIIMKLLNLVYCFVCPLSILSTLEFRGANLAWDAHSNTVTKSKSCWAEQHTPDTEGEGGSRGEGRREAGAGDGDTSFRKMLLGPNFICRVLGMLLYSHSTPRLWRALSYLCLPFCFRKNPQHKMEYRHSALPGE